MQLAILWTTWEYGSYQEAGQNNDRITELQELLAASLIELQEKHEQEEVMTSSVMHQLDNGQARQFSGEGQKMVATSTVDWTLGDEQKALTE